mgnify:CR=1 FL=1
MDAKLREQILDHPMENAPKMLQHVLGSVAKQAFGVSLLASRQSSTMTGTYAGQFVMEGKQGHLRGTEYECLPIIPMEEIVLVSKIITCIFVWAMSSGFLDIQLNPALRNLVTRTVAILPSLLCTLIAGEEGSEALIIFSSVVLSFQLPFALLPLMKLTSSKRFMGARFANSKSMVTSHLPCMCIMRSR